MKCEFSETQFAFCYVFELINNNPERFVMPWFPNTVQEGREGGGYDVNINGSLFLQFKIPEYLKTKQKYKIKIDTNHKQYVLLKELKRPANLVYYCAPKFHEEYKIRELYNDKMIGENSVLFPIEEFPNDGEYHKLKYEYISGENHTYGVLSSDPKKISSVSDVFSGNFKPDRMSLNQKANFVLNNIVSKIEHIPNVKQINDVDWLFSLLLLHYNILWIPIKSFPIKV
ncbi:MAG: hypothetical protein HYX61_10205 [Gammaproteobacteria bacterium]|jgi:hypothetical protein|nr:hypothetical protein [Gammaproteobacteria bacterium]